VRTTVVIDEQLLKKAQEALGTETIRDTVERALQDAVRRHGREQLLALRGQIDLDLTLEELERLRSEE